MLHNADKSDDPCYAYKQLSYLKNFLRTQSDSFSSARKWIPFAFNYKEQAGIRSGFFER